MPLPQTGIGPILGPFLQAPPTAKKGRLILSQFGSDWPHGPPVRWILLFSRQNEPPLASLFRRSGFGQRNGELPANRRHGRQFNGRGGAVVSFVQLRVLIDSGLHGMNFPRCRRTYHRPARACSCPGALSLVSNPPTPGSNFGYFCVWAASGDLRDGRIRLRNRPSASRDDGRGRARRFWHSLVGPRCRLR
jgi:hypothetical protein